jgi:two-component system NarL family sensor kinase
LNGWIKSAHSINFIVIYLFCLIYVLVAEIVFFVCGISVIVIGLIFTLIFFSKNSHNRAAIREQAFKIEKKKLEMQFLKAQIFTLEEERQRMANSLHDDVNPLLAALKNQIKLSIIDYVNGEFKQDKFLQFNQLIDKIIEHQNSSIKNLAPKINDLQDLDRALLGYFSIVGDFKIEYTCDLDEIVPVDKFILKNTYSIILELVHNIAKHEKIEFLNVHLDVITNGLNIILKHNGIGLTNQEFNRSIQRKEGRGLSSINSRVKYMTAKLDLMKMDEGALILLSIPLNNGEGN